MEYHAESLEEVAELFEGRAADEGNEAEKLALTQKDKAWHKGAAAAYREAATVMRTLKLK
jgi:hypothetical protein